MEFILDRSKWICGKVEKEDRTCHGKGITRLLNDRGFMCCLGQFSKQLGCTDRQIFQHSSPAELLSDKEFPVNESKISIFIEDREDNDLVNDAIEINDNGDTTRIQKIIRLKKLFKEHGHTIKVVGKYNV